jgi:hypothetical protein
MSPLTKISHFIEMVFVIERKNNIVHKQQNGQSGTNSGA